MHVAKGDEGLNLVEFSVKGFPPAYDSGNSILNKNHKRYPLVVKLQNATRDAMNGKFLDGVLSLELYCEATQEHDSTDTANLVGGTTNSLEGIVYLNDNQIKEIHCKRILSNQDKYTVRIAKVGH